MPLGHLIVVDLRDVDHGFGGAAVVTEHSYLPWRSRLASCWHSWNHPMAGSLGARSRARSGDGCFTRTGRVFHPGMWGRSAGRRLERSAASGFVQHAVLEVEDPVRTVRELEVVRHQNHREAVILPQREERVVQPLGGVV